jgi:hypothetical protein
MSCVLGCISPLVQTTQYKQQVKKNSLFGQTTASSLYTVRMDSTYDPTYCKSGPSDRNPIGKGEAIKYNSYDRYLNRMRKKNCV